jgi:hypothetical protein
VGGHFFCPDRIFTAVIAQTRFSAGIPREGAVTSDVEALKSNVP